VSPVGVAGLLALLSGRRVGLVTGPSGWLGAAGHLAQRLAGEGLLGALFAPEHGIWGDLQAGEHVADTRDPCTGVPVHSLYGVAAAPEPAQLDGLDAVVGCLQDAGARPYTYAATLAGCLRACAAAGKPFVVLDRPTPLGGVVCQGNVAGGAFFPLATPMRPGLTLGEHLRLLVHEQRLDAELVCVPLVPWPRARWYDETGLPWVAPSPNLPTLESALCFAATVVLEGTNVSEGRGTTRPFELLGAPWCDGQALAADLNRRRLPGLVARAAAFVPTFSKHVGAVCRGVQLHVVDRLRCDPPVVGLHVVDALWRLWPDSLRFDAASFDARYDDPAVRAALLAGATPEAIAAAWPGQLAAFRARAAAAGVGPCSWREV
jgi:uncharacterized protein YbbC (DUF1343 family)